MRPSLDELRGIAARALALAEADEVEVAVDAATSATTRFARNRIHQNTLETDVVLTLRAIIGTGCGVASTNRLDDASLARSAAAATEAARHAPADPSFPGLPEARQVRRVERSRGSAREYDEMRRAEAVREITAQATARGLSAAGTVACRDSGIVVVNSRGVEAAADSSEVRVTVLATGPGGGSGWASFCAPDGHALVPSALGARAAVTAGRSRDGGPLEPGTYTVVLAPEAVAELVSFLGYLGFAGKGFAEGSTFLTQAIGQRIVDERISLYDDALAPAMVGRPFDHEGQPKLRTALIEGGVAVGPVTDSYHAHLLGRANTGHALGVPNPYGPLPGNLVLAKGDASPEELVASVTRGVYVSRLHYVNVEDPVKVVLTGMTRDGTFLIEGGRITRALRNLRFTQGILEALCHVGAVGAERELIAVDDGGRVLAPALLLERWSFTGQTT